MTDTGQTVATKSPPVTAKMELDGSRLRCERCGVDRLIPLPLEMGAAVRWLKRFAKEHCACEGTAP